MLRLFWCDGRPQKALILLFLFINALVLFNALAHDPTIAYDIHSHLSYINTLAQGRLPGRADSPEFFCPPLPYLLPAWLHSLQRFDFRTIARFGQVFNIIFSMGTTLFLLRICEFLRPGNTPFKIASLAFLGLMPAYYKTFVMIRGEPLLSFFTVAAIDQSLRLFSSAADKNIIRQRWLTVCLLGLILGLAILSRQWGFLLLPAIGLWTFLQNDGGLAKKTRLALLAATLAVAMATGGWFYGWLYHEHGSVIAFNQQGAASWRLDNQPAGFYLGSHWSRMFYDPVRPNFVNQIIPILYSDFWGDYWGYFLVWAKDRRNNQNLFGRILEEILTEQGRPDWLETNRFTINHYLGRANLISLVPTAILVAGFFYGIAAVKLMAVGLPSTQQKTCALLALGILAFITGYLWFLIRFPRPECGDNIKAAYLLQTFSLLAILAGEFLQRCRNRFPKLYRTLALFCSGVALHNLPLLITRHFSFL